MVARFDASNRSKTQGKAFCLLYMSHSIIFTIRVMKFNGSGLKVESCFFLEHL
jgi:hypothetical protein